MHLMSVMNVCLNRLQLSVENVCLPKQSCQRSLNPIKPGVNTLCKILLKSNQQKTLEFVLHYFPEMQNTCPQNPASAQIYQPFLQIGSSAAHLNLKSL